MIKYTGLILAYNEEKNIFNVIQQTKDVFDHLIIVNDASTDKTLEEINKHKSDNLIVINNNKNRGAGYSTQIGIEKFLKINNSDFLLKIDGDGQFNINDIKNLIEISSTNNNVGLIKCDRFWVNGINGEIPFVRFLGNSLANLLIKISTGNWKINDPLNGLFLFSRRLLVNFSIPKLFRRYGYPFYINIYAHKFAYKNEIKIIQTFNTIKYNDESSQLNPITMFFKLTFFTVFSFVTKIKDKVRYSELQISAVFDILFLILLNLSFYSLIRVVLTRYFSYNLGSQANWLLLSFLLLIFSLFLFINSQKIESNFFKDKFNISK